MKLHFRHSYRFCNLSVRKDVSKETEMTGIKPGVLIVYFAWSVVIHVLLSGELERLTHSAIVASVELRQPRAACRVPLDSRACARRRTRVTYTTTCVIGTPMAVAGGGFLLSGCCLLPKNLKTEKYFFLDKGNIKGCVWFTLQPKSATEIGWWLIRLNIKKIIETDESIDFFSYF